VVKDFPAVPEYRRELARTYNNLGKLFVAQQNFAEAAKAYGQAVALRQKLVDERPGVPSYRGELAVSQLGMRNLQWSWASALDGLKRHAEALPHWDQALELSSPADRPVVQMRRARSRVLAGQPAAAVADAAALTKDPATPGSTLLYNAACVYALAAAAVRDDGPRREAHAGQALSLLRRARAAGFFKDRKQVEHMQKDPDLDALRSREDFRQFVAELEAAVKQ